MASQQPDSLGATSGPKLFNAGINLSLGLGSWVEVQRRISLANFNQSSVKESRNCHFSLPFGDKCGFTVRDLQKCQGDSGQEAVQYSAGRTSLRLYGGKWRAICFLRRGAQNYGRNSHSSQQLAFLRNKSKLSLLHMNSDKPI